MAGPAVMVHGLGMASLAMQAGLAAGRLPSLLSAPGAGTYGGVGWWRAMMEQARAATHILDCGRAPGRALEALRAGQKYLVLQADPRVWSDIAGRAADCGGVLLAHAPPALDLAEPNAARRLQAWLHDGPEIPDSDRTGIDDTRDTLR